MLIVAVEVASPIGTFATKVTLALPPGSVATLALADVLMVVYKDVIGLSVSYSCVQEKIKRL